MQQKLNEANNNVSRLTNQLNDVQAKLNDSTSKNNQLKKELDVALQDAKNTQAHAEEVLKQNN
ncbi:hypothetical protein [Leuconostoc mesenteroides]|uniref:hypothetical protein n=1 Tax=Leuconostoc mesenteroides TaxID=1245 RepID=UPI00235FEF12|nr:hypothetical protein [Leuconostoc mesenteroides]